MRLLLPFGLLPALLSTGCASILHGTSDTISVNSMEKDTIIYVDGTPRGKDNARGQIKRGDVHTITASKEGCQDVTMKTTDSFDIATLLGIFLDYGIISIPIDLISGAAWKTDQSIVTLSPICPKVAALPLMPAQQVETERPQRNTVPDPAERYRRSDPAAYRWINH